MPWETPITDRNQTDINNKTIKAYYNISDFNRIEQNTSYLSTEMNLNLITKAWTITDFPTEADFTRIETNIQTIRATLYTYQTTPLNPIHPATTYIKANALEQILKDVEELYRLNKNAIDYIGEIYADQDIGVI